MKGIIPRLFCYDLEQTMEFLMWSWEEITSHRPSQITQKGRLFQSLIKPIFFNLLI